MSWHRLSRIRFKLKTRTTGALRRSIVGLAKQSQVFFTQDDKADDCGFEETKLNGGMGV